MPVEMRVTTMEKGGGGNASTNTIGAKNNSYTLSESNPLYEASLRYKKKKEEELEQENQKKLSEKRESDKKKAEYFSKTFQPFVSAYNQIVDATKGYFEGWQDERESAYTKGMFTSLQENLQKLKNSVSDNSYLQEVMSPDDYEKAISDLDLIGSSLSDAVDYVSNASSVYSQFSDADSYNKHTRLSGMSADDLQREIDALDKQIGDMGNADSYYDTMYVMGQPMKKATEKSKKFESDLAELERQKKELTSYRDTARLGENVKKYGVDPSKLSYEALTSYVNDKNLSMSDPGKYDFIKSYYDGMDAGEKADLFVKGLDPTTKDLYEKASELVAKNSASSVATSQSGSTINESSADLKRVDELIGIISSRTGFDEQTVRKNIGMVQRYMNAERAEETGKAVVKAVEKAPVLSNIASVGLNLGGGLFALADQAGQTVANIISGENEDIDTNTAAQSIVKISDDIRNTTRKKIEKSTNVTLPSGANLGAYLYDTAMSLADVVAQTSTGRVIGAGLSGKALNNAISATTSLIVGSNSAASTVQESVESGESSVKALAKGLAVGLIESLIEKAGIDNVLNATLRGDAAAKVILRSALAEGTEEVLTNIATEDFLESYVFGGSTRYQKAFESYISQGLSREEAAKRASADVVAQDAETFLSSALIGTVFGGVTAVSNRANDKANTKLAQDGINNELGGIGEIEFLKNVNLRMENAQENLDDDALKDAARRINDRIERIRLIENDVKNNSSMRNVIGESGIQQEVAKMEANIATLTDKLNLIRNGEYDPTVQGYMISLMEEDLTKTTEEQAKSQRNVLKAAQMYLSAFGSEKKAVEAAKKTAAQENARAAELSAERNRLTQALTTADETQKVEINRRIQEIGREIKRTARNVIRAGKVEKALGDQYRSAINSALGGNEKELSKRLTNALGREVKVAYDDNAKGFSSMKTGADSSTLTVNPELILRTENALRQEFGEEYTGNLAKEKLVHEIAHAAARSDANFDAKVLDIYHLLRDNGLITDDDIDEAATREAYKDTLKRYMATEPAKAEVRRLVEAGNAEADAIAAVENAYIGEELVAQTLEWMERATNGQLSREILGEKRNVFAQALNRIAEIFRSVAAKLKGVDNVNAAKTAGFADKIERFAREFAERGLAEMNEGKSTVSQESAGATQSADNAQGNSGEGAVASSESEASTGAQEEDERFSLGYRRAGVNESILSMIQRVKSGNFKDNETVDLGVVPDEVASSIEEITGIDVRGFHTVIEARQIRHIIKDHGENGITDHSMKNDEDIAKIEYALDTPDDIRESGTTKAYTQRVDSRDRMAGTVLYEKYIGSESYYVVQAVTDNKKKTLYIVSAFIGRGGYKKGTSAQPANAQSPDVTSENATMEVPKNSVSQNDPSVNRESVDERFSLESESERGASAKESYAEISRKQMELNHRENELRERKREIQNNPELLRVMDEYSDLFNEMRELLPKRRKGTATQEELDRIEEIKVTRDEMTDRISELQESIGLNAIAKEETEIREMKEALRIAADEAWEREGAEREERAIKKAGVSAEEYFRKKAIKAFKTTSNFNEAGYLLPDGKLLDFSGGERNHRYRDHREIGEIYEATNGTAALNRFLRDGNIRVMAESPGIDLASLVEPTSEQYSAIRRFINSHGLREGQFFVDFSDAEGRRSGNYSYAGRVSADRIINDIKYFYQTGETRAQSELEQFRFSLPIDSMGYKLSEEQQNFFRDSVVRDEDGRLKVMYHGTPSGDFTVFRDGTYFSENQWYADLYQNPGASSINSRKNVTNPKTYKVYLNIKKPFDISDEEARDIYINEYIKGGNAVGINPYLSDAEYAKISSIDWTEGEDLREFLIDNEYDYDGLVLDEGAVGGYGDDVKYRGKSYVIFNPEQVKDVENKNPTSNPDIRFSLSPETDADYMAAVERGDIETAQRMVDEAAKAAGYPVKAYHGTPTGGFTSFDYSKIGSNTGVGRGRFSFTSDKATADVYADKKNVTPRASTLVSDLNSLFHAYDSDEIREIFKGATDEGMVTWDADVVIGDGALDSGYITFDYDWEDNDPELYSSPSEARYAEGLAKYNGTREYLVDTLKDYQRNAPESTKPFFKAAFEMLENASAERTPMTYSVYIPSPGKVYKANTETYNKVAWDAAYDSANVTAVELDNGETRYFVRDAEDIKSADPITYDDNGNVIPLSERFNTDNEDIRYSLSDEQRMKRQAENIAFLKKQIQRGRSYAVSPSALDKVWAELRRGYGIDKADEQTVRDMFKIVDDMSMHKMDADDGMARLNAMAREVLTNVYQIDDHLMRENEAFIQYIRSTPLSVPADSESDLGGKYGDYRNANRRYVNLSREGTPVESVYEQICDMFPGILDRSLKNPVEQIHEIVKEMRKMDPVDKPKYSDTMDSAAESFVSDVMAKMDRYSRETFRSKSERDKEILRDNAERQAAAERNRSDILRAREAEEYEKRVKRMEAQNRNTVNAYEARIQGIETAAARDAMQYREIINNLQNRMDEISVKNDRRDYSDALRRDARVIRSAAVSPNQKRFIPEEYRKTIERIADFLDKVSRYNGTYRTDMADMAVYEDIRSLAPLYGDDFAQMAAYLVNEIEWTAGADMAEDRVAPMVALRVAQNAYKLGRLIRTSIARQNRMVLDGKNRNANYISGELIDSLNNRRNVEKEFNTLETDEKGKLLSSSDSGKLLERMEKRTRKTRKWISLNTMDGYSFLRRMGKVGESLYDTLRAAQSEQIMHVQEYVKTLQDKLLKDQQDGAKGVDLSRYIGDKQKTVTVTLSSGEKYTMTAAQAMTIVTLYEREAGKSHIENGGVRLVHPKDKTLSSAVALKAEDVAAIAQNLDEDDRRVMKVMNDFIREQCTEWGNEATLERYGFYRFNTQHYFPITVDRNALPSNVSAEGAKDYLQFNVQNVGFAKAADASAKAPVVIDSFISVINRHVEGMATYAAYLNAEDIVNRLMSAPGVKDAMQRSLGTGAVKYMTDMMTELKQGNRGGSEDALTQWWNKSAGHYKSAAVSYNLSTALKQPISIVRAAAVLDPKYILAAKRVPLSGTGKAAHEEMMQYSGIGVKKSVGYSDVGISRDINAQIGYEKKDLSKKVRNVSEFGMALAGYMDEWTWDSIWIACREEVKDKKPDLTANHEAFMNEVAKRFAEVVAQTQVVDSPLDSSPLSRSKSPLARNVFAFTSEPIKGFNLLMNAMDDLINAEKGSIRQKQAAAQMARTAVITLVGWAAEASISAAFQMIRDEDDDEGEIAKEFGVKFGKQMMSNAYNVVPYIGQLVDIVMDAWKGYDFTDMGIAPLVDVIDSAKSVMDTLRNPENKSETIVKAGRDFVESVATFFGIPIRNFNRDVVAGLRLFFHITDLYTAEYEMQKIFYNPKSSTAREKHEFNSLLTDAYLSGNKKAFEHIYNDMRSMGLSPQTIMNGIAKDAYAQDITSTGSTLTRYTPGSDAWYIGMKGIFDRDLTAPDGLEKELTRLYKATEEKGVLPKYKSDSYTVDGESKELSVKDHEAVLSEYSKLYYEIATILRNSPAYKNADDTLKAYWMAQAERYAGAISIYRVDSEYTLRTKWWEKMKDKPYYDVAGYIITNLKPSKEDE